MATDEEDIKQQERSLLEWVNETEHEAKKKRWGVAPFPYERLAILYRKNKNYLAEVEILERFARQPHAPGVTPPRLLERLNKAKALLFSAKKE